MRGITSGSTSFITPLNNTAWNFAQSSIATTDPVYQTLANAAYGRLIGGLGEMAQIGTNIAEGRETLALVGTQGSRVKGVYDGFRSIFNAQNRLITSVTRLRKGVLALKRGRLNDFTAHLRIKRRKTDPAVFKPSDRTVSKLWLEYWFGIAPLISDIQNSIRILTSDFPRGKLFGSARNDAKTSTVQGGYWFRDCDFKTRVYQGCHVRVANPNTFLRQSLGFNNWLSIGLEVIPFSFMLSWVSNLSGFVSSMTDLDGLEVTLPYTSAITRASSRDLMIYPAAPCDASFTAVHTRRDIGITRPVLRWALPKALSVTRGATAIALLVQIFT
jgi:hypothetical protein